MILGIGTDIVRTARFTEILTRNPQRMQRLCERILHPKEAELLSESNRAQVLASAWAAKEALYKSLDASEQKNCVFNEWRKAWVNGRQELISEKSRSDKFLVSISHDAGLTTAFVVRTAK